MNATDYWNIFIETGAPEMYLLFNKARRMEEEYVSDNAVAGTESLRLQ